MQAPAMLRLNAQDNVLVSNRIIEKGEIAAEGIATTARIMRGHKMASILISQGSPIRKFGQIIGFAKTEIAAGDWVHEHNVEMGNLSHDYAFAQAAKSEILLAEKDRATFQGFRRKNGKVGTRNYIGIMTSVNCSATVANFIAQDITRSGILKDYPNIDGVVALTQDNGCVIDYRGVIFDIFKRTAWGYATNPNMGGVMMVGLGCEGFQIPRFKEAYKVEESETFRTMTIQETGGTKKTVAAGVEAVKAMLPAVNAAKRETCSASELTAGNIAFTASTPAATVFFVPPVSWMVIVRKVSPSSTLYASLKRGI